MIALRVLDQVHPFFFSSLFRFFVLFVWHSSFLLILDLYLGAGLKYLWNKLGKQTSPRSERSDRPLSDRPSSMMSSTGERELAQTMDSVSVRSGGKGTIRGFFQTFTLARRDGGSGAGSGGGSGVVEGTDDYGGPSPVAQRALRRMRRRSSEARLENIFAPRGINNRFTMTQSATLPPTTDSLTSSSNSTPTATTTTTTATTPTTPIITEVESEKVEKSEN
jgi:hypothetical protein